MQSYISSCIFASIVALIPLFKIEGDPSNFHRECLSSNQLRHFCIHHTLTVNICFPTVYDDGMDFCCIQNEFKNTYLTLGRIVHFVTHHTSKSLYAVISE